MFVCGIELLEITIIQRSPPPKINPWRPSPRLIVSKMTKRSDKDRILKAMSEMKAVTYKGNPITLSTDFSAETL